MEKNNRVRPTGKPRAALETTRALEKCFTARFTLFYIVFRLLRVMFPSPNKRHKGDIDSRFTTFALTVTFIEGADCLTCESESRGSL